LRILVTSFTFPPQANGVAEIARAQACGLAARGHEVTVATDADPRRTAEHAFGRLRVESFAVQGRFASGRGYEGEVARYQDFIANGPFDIILCNCWQNWATDLAVPAFPRSGARKVIVTQGLDAHLWHPHPRFAWGLPSWARGLAYTTRLPGMMRAFDQVVFLSRRRDWGRFFDHWLAVRCGLDHVSIIPNGIDLGPLQQVTLDFRATYGIRTPHLILNVANYCDRKNQLATLRAFLKARRRDATMVFIGSEWNEYAANLRRVHEAHGQQAGPVLFLERVPRAHIYAAYQAADLFILNAKAETQPLVLLDAMASAVPFLSTDTGCVSEFAGGCLVRGEGDTARALGRLLDDPARRRELGEAGRAQAHARYSWEQVITECERVFSRLLAAGGPARA
jgi:glycosyltransferase involved in cell wall biosynthesis